MIHAPLDCCPAEHNSRCARRRSPHRSGTSARCACLAVRGEARPLVTLHVHDEWSGDIHLMTGTAAGGESPRAVPRFAPPCAHARVRLIAPAAPAAPAALAVAP